MKYILFLICCFFALPVFSQSMYWETTKDLLKGNALEASFDMAQLSSKKKARNLGGEYKIIKLKGKNKKKIKHAKFVESNHVLYLNLEGIEHEDAKFGKYFIPCFRISKDSVIFKAVKLSRQILLDRTNEAVKQSLGDSCYNFNTHRYKSNSFFCDIVNTLFSCKRADKLLERNKVIYIYSLDGGETKIVNCFTMPGLLLSLKHPELIPAYERLDSKSQESPEIVISYLRRTGIFDK